MGDEEHNHSVDPYEYANNLNLNPFNLNTAPFNLNTAPFNLNSAPFNLNAHNLNTALMVNPTGHSRINLTHTTIQGNHAQSHQSNSPIRPYSTYDPRIQPGRGNMAPQVSRPSLASSLKRSSSQPPASTVHGQRRKTVPVYPFIQPSIPTPTPTRLPPSLFNTPQPIPRFIPPPHSLTPRPTYSSIPPIFPSTQLHSALSAFNISHTIPPSLQTSAFVTPHHTRISSHTPPPPNHQLLTLSQAQQRLRAHIISSATNISPHHIKYTDETPEPIGHKCFLCKRDLSYTPDGPIFQPAAPPAAAVLSCGHTFHEQCMERITPDDHSNDPPCIPCALGNQ